MQLNSVAILLMSLAAGTAIAAPLNARQSSVAGQACTDGTFDGTCRADGRCGLEIPPNEVSFQFIQGQCGVGSNNDVNNDNDDADDANGNNGGANNNNNNNNNNNASVEGQACTDGTFDGTCRADGRCGLEIPPNELSLQFVQGQCGVGGGNANAGNNNAGNNNADEDNTDDTDDAASVEGQSCTDGTFDGTCRADGRCGLEIPPNELSLQFVQGQCGVGGGNDNDNANTGTNNDNADEEDDADNTDDDAASFEGQSCTDGVFDGVCLANGRCALEIPPNINSQEFVSGQCGQ